MRQFRNFDERGHIHSHAHINGNVMHFYDKKCDVSEGDVVVLSGHKPLRAVSVSRRDVPMFATDRGYTLQYCEKKKTEVLKRDMTPSRVVKNGLVEVTFEPHDGDMPSDITLMQYRL